VFITKPWACSMTQIDWSAEGFEGTKLVYLAMGAGFFYERHRAGHDCIAAIELRALSLPKAGVPAMARLLERARRPSWRIWAENGSTSSTCSKRVAIVRTATKIRTRGHGTSM
jgi:DNA polymerase-3 subunit epsilon